jgi:hypothetical protein
VAGWIIFGMVGVIMSRTSMKFSRCIAFIQLVCITEWFCITAGVDGHTNKRQQHLRNSGLLPGDGLSHLLREDKKFQQKASIVKLGNSINDVDTSDVFNWKTPSRIHSKMLRRPFANLRFLERRRNGILKSSAVGSLQSDTANSPTDPVQNKIEETVTQSSSDTDAPSNSPTNSVGNRIEGTIAQSSRQINEALESSQAASEKAIESVKDTTQVMIQSATDAAAKASTHIQDVYRDKVAPAAQAAGQAIADGARTAGSAIADGARAAGSHMKDVYTNKISPAAQAAGSAIADGARAAGSHMKDVYINKISPAAQAAGKAIADGAKSAAAHTVKGAKIAGEWASKNVINPIAEGAKRQYVKVKSWVDNGGLERTGKAIKKQAISSGNAFGSSFGSCLTSGLSHGQGEHIDNGPQPTIIDKQVCVACKFIWTKVQEEVGGKDFVEDDVLMALNSQCQDAPDIFYDGCDEMYKRSDEFIEMYKAGKGVPYMCKQQGFCWSGLLSDDSSGGDSISAAAGANSLSNTLTSSIGAASLPKLSPL